MIDMRTAFTTSLICLVFAASQGQAPDSTGIQYPEMIIPGTSKENPDLKLRTFIAKPVRADLCNPTGSIGFEVLREWWQSGFEPILVVYIDRSAISPLTIEDTKFYTIKGRLTWKTERVHGCYSNFRDERRAFIYPTPVAVFIQRSFSSASPSTFTF
jgi:hypothetical protein